MTSLRYLIICAALLVLPSGPALSGNWELLQSIENARARGELSMSRAALYNLYAHKAPERLPAGYRAPMVKISMSAPPGIDRCSTLEMIGLRKSIAAMDPADRAEAQAILGMTAQQPLALPKTFALGAAKVVSHTLTYWIETANFSIEWGSTLTNQDGTTPLKDVDSNGVPDVIDLWASYLEFSYAALRQIGFTDTTPLDTYKIQVFIANSDPTKTIDNLTPNYYGETDGDVPHIPGTPPAYMIVSNDFSVIEAYVPNDERATSLEAAIRGAMMVTAAHELNHVMQFIYAPSRWATISGENADSWFLEATSTWAEDEVFPFVNDYKQYFDPSYLNPGQFLSYGWQQFPEMTLAVARDRAYPDPLFTGPTIRKNRTYGSMIFIKYLAEHLGGPGTVMQTWRRLKLGDTIPQAVASAANTATTSASWTMDDVFLGFAGANATMDYDDGVLYGKTPRRISGFPEIYGSALVDDQPVTTDATRSFSLSGLTPSFTWGVSLVSALDTSTEKFSLVLPAKTNSATINASSGSVLTGVAAFTGPATTTLAYTPAFSDSAATDATSPSQVGGLTLQAQPQGLLAQWNSASDNAAVAGYVVEWKKTADSKWKGRTLAGNVTRAIIGNLVALTGYDVRAFAYDTSGNRGAPSAVSSLASGAAWARPTTIPLSPPSQNTPVSSGGGGGGGCFLKTLEQ